MEAVLPLEKRCSNFNGDLSIRAGTIRDPEIEDAPSLVGGAKTDVSNRYLWFHASSPVQDSFERWSLSAEIQVSRWGGYLACSVGEPIQERSRDDSIGSITRFSL